MASTAICGEFQPVELRKLIKRHGQHERVDLEVAQLRRCALLVLRLAADSFLFDAGLDLERKKICSEIADVERGLDRCALVEKRSRDEARGRVLRSSPRRAGGLAHEF